LIWTAKLNGINPQHYLTDVLSRIAAIRRGRSPNCYVELATDGKSSALLLDPAPSPSAYPGSCLSCKRRFAGHLETASNKSG